MFFDHEATQEAAQLMDKSSAVALILVVLLTLVVERVKTVAEAVTIMLFALAGSLIVAPAVAELLTYYRLLTAPPGSAPFNALVFFFGLLGRSIVKNIRDLDIRAVVNRKVGGNVFVNSGEVKVEETRQETVTKTTTEHKQLPPEA